MSIVVFTDLDGTLLDHDTYSWEAASPALAELKALRIPLVLASSKTEAEIAVLHQSLGLEATPAIVENGAGIYRPASPSSISDSAYHRLRGTLASLPPDARSLFIGFGDMSNEEVAQATGLTPAQARLARRRRFTEPGFWRGTHDALTEFIAALQDQGVHVRQGGRFLSLSFGRTKAQAMQEVAQELGATMTIALGDAPNDREMLEAADIGIIVRNDKAHPLPPMSGEDTGRIVRTQEEGPFGWNTALLQVLAQAGQEKEAGTHG